MNTQGTIKAGGLEFARNGDNIIDVYRFDDLIASIHARDGQAKTIVRSYFLSNAELSALLAAAMEFQIVLNQRRGEAG